MIGFEPMTCSLRMSCTTAVLHWLEIYLNNVTHLYKNASEKSKKRVFLKKKCFFSLGDLLFSFFMLHCFTLILEF